MKSALLAVCAVSLLTSCAAVHVVDTQTAAVVTESPKAIYIRPFDVEGANFVGHHKGGPGERPIRQSLAPREFSEALQFELEKLAPARILQEDEIAPSGWLVEGSIDEVDAGSPVKRGLLPPHVNPLGRSKINIHVRITDLERRSVASEAKDGSTLRSRGKIIYQFDLAGGSRTSGMRGTISAPGFGYAAPFDYRNAAERVRSAVEADEHGFGVRNSTNIRY